MDKAIISPLPSVDSSSASALHEISIPVNKAGDICVAVHLTIRERSITLFISKLLPTTRTASPPSLGSFVYAIPNKYHGRGPALSTTLYSVESTIESTTRLARLLAQKTNRPVYVGNSVPLSRNSYVASIASEIDDGEQDSLLNSIGNDDSEDRENAEVALFQKIVLTVEKKLARNGN